MPEHDSLRAVPHPYLFSLLSKKLRIVFLRTSTHLDLRKELAQLSGVDIFPVRGFHDFALFHLDGTLRSLDYQLHSAKSHALFEDSDTFYFEGDNFLKFGGQPVVEPSQPLLAKPAALHLAQVVALTKEWNALREAERTKLAKLDFIMPNPVPSQSREQLRSACLRRSLVFVHLVTDTPATRKVFEESVLDPYKAIHEVQAIVVGRTQGGSTYFPYMLDIVANPYRTDEITFEIQDKAIQRYIAAPTRTIDLEGLAVMTRLWDSVLYPTIGELEGLVLARALDAARSRGKAKPLEDVFGHWGYQRRIIETSHQALNELGFPPELSSIVGEFVDAVLSGEKSDYAQPVTRLLSYLSSRLLALRPEISDEVTPTAGRVISSYFRRAGEKADKEFKAASLRLNEIRNWYAHPVDNRLNLEGLKLEEVDQLFCQTLARWKYVEESDRRDK